MASFNQALALGAQAIELDVRCVDGRLLVFHDETLDRTTNGTGLLYAHSVTQLRRFDAGEGQPIPFLEEVCALVDRRAAINIELKDAASVPAVVALVVRCWQQGWAQNSLWLSCFSHEILQQIRACHATVPIGVLVEDRVGPAIELARQLRAVALHPSRKLVTRELVERAHHLNLAVYVYTVNEPEEIGRLRQWGVDGVFCNYPERVREVAAGLVVK
ncbi:MAG: hypothetical protein JXR59_00265 [Desulfuromonadaceae bacterium]|nr:hypothetical protein [Desulfuromonadaceae bacterium]